MDFAYHLCLADGLNGVIGCPLTECELFVPD